jgi:hypothetical protein
MPGVAVNMILMARIFLDVAAIAVTGRGESAACSFEAGRGVGRRDERGGSDVSIPC